MDRRREVLCTSIFKKVNEVSATRYRGSGIEVRLQIVVLLLEPLLHPATRFLQVQLLWEEQVDFQFLVYSWEVQHGEDLCQVKPPQPRHRHSHLCLKTSRPKQSCGISWANNSKARKSNVEQATIVAIVDDCVVIIAVTLALFTRQRIEADVSCNQAAHAEQHHVIEYFLLISGKLCNLQLLNQYGGDCC